ncbi:MAG: hypothetical protein DRN15_11320 [Thermoprotei archaeon]|nr:MAG: hypothetical protein DRN15_11320 [Thermoprotei archaeon]
MGGVPENLVDENVVIVHYDLPVPKSRARQLVNNDPNDRELRLLLAKWRTWYDWATETLRSLGYPIGYSVIIADVERLKTVHEVSERVKERYQKLKNMDKWGLLPSESKIRIGVVRFRPASSEDLKTLEVMFKDYLKDSLETIKDYIIRKLKAEKKDPKDVNRRVREMLRRLKKQDRFRLLEHDPELKKLLALIDVITTEV